MIDFSRISRTITNYVVLYGMKILVALLILVVGLWLIKRITNFLFRLMEKRGVDPSLIPFLHNIANISLRILLIIVVISQIGIEATSFLAILGSAGIAIGLALQGSLSNFAGGVLLLTLRPFRVGDFIEVQGQSGKVHLINIFNTVIKTGDNKTIFIPNGPLASSTIINHDVEENRRVDMKFTIAATNNVNKAKEVLFRIAARDTRILKDPPPKVVIAEMSATEVKLLVRVWAHHSDYWEVFYNMQEQVKEEFEKEQIV
ncbi:mechanosensitive ion channel family protein [Adhaeribacter soli]|uniref:Mechanosensitive ion channel n=1 Tax=Adhaeribacter soli TaxID=2607655 RepID=A0A5N1IRM6_9BACT|nr:mechanosensitive ion channel domain-containing protein [Adhaeribacter soli]KAA9332647.1 mechanosensitive ion channel [Adhaeribacter soli]